MKTIAAALALVAAAAVAAAKLPSHAAADGCPLPCSGPSASPPDAKLLLAQPQGEAGPLLAYDTAVCRLRFALPAGRASADGRTFVAATAAGARTRLQRFAAATGTLVRTDAVPGRWRLAAVSPDGRFVALSRRGAAATAVRLVDARGRTRHTLALPGDVEVEAISKDGARLFLIEHVDDHRYRVRTLDLRSELAAAIRKRGVLAPMSGYAWAAVGSPDGRWLLTLYVDTARRSAFVHALDLVHARPLCIAVPSRGPRTALERYALKLSPDARTLFAANPALGAVAEIDLGRLRVERVTRFRPPPIAEPPSRRGAAATISRDGRTLSFTAGRSLLALDRARGRVRGPYPTWGRVVALGFGAGDRRVHVLRGDGRLVAFDAGTGRMVAR
jgi:hypothetical protein